MTRTLATINERGNGFPGVGEYVACGGEVYRVAATNGRIHTGEPNYIYAEIELADWSDVGDDEEPYCDAVIDPAET